MSGSAAPAAMLAALIVIMVAVTVYVFVANPFPSRPPASITSVGLLVDHQYFLTLCVTGVVFILSQLGLAYAIWRFRDRGQTAHFTRGSNTLEMIWTTATIVLFLGLGLMGRKAWAEVRFTTAEANAVQVEVTTNQFVFNFRYPGPDGKFGITNPKLMDPSAGSEAAIGLDSNDPASKDDVVTGTMFLPVNRQIDLTLRAVDVIHSFFIPNMRFKQDAVPGLAIHMHITPTQTGDYEIACAELCGLGHYKMHGMVKVVSQEDFDKWIAAREAEKQ